MLGSDESLRVKNALKLFLKVLERKNVQNQTISEIYTDDKKSKRSSNPTDILKSANKFIWKILYQRDNFQTTTAEFITKISSRKIQNSQEMMAYTQNFMNIFQMN